MTVLWAVMVHIELLPKIFINEYWITEGRNTMIVKMIKKEELKHHPRNPRQNYGDLTEMIGSIRENGIIQNLSVVADEDDGGYFVVAGNRRLRAGLKADLTEFPCEIKDWSEQKVAQIMLIENGQRNDLTPYEEALGFQYMMELGQTKKEIAKETGFSQSTINSRFKLLDLNQETLKEVSEEQEISIMDLAKLNKIKNKKRKNSVLKKIGTSNFDFEVNKAVVEEEKEKKKREFLKELSKHAKEISEDVTSDYKFVNTYFGDISDIPDDTNDRNYYYTVNTYGTVSLYRDYTDEDKQAANELENHDVKQTECNQMVNDVVEAMRNTRLSFIKTLNYKKQFDDIIKLSLANIIIEKDFSGFHYSNGIDTLDILSEIYGLNGDETGECAELINKLSQNNAYPLYIVFAKYESNIKNINVQRLFDADKISVNANLKFQYDFLKKLGYKLSDDEERFLTGTHEIYGKVAEFLEIKLIDNKGVA